MTSPGKIEFRDVPEPICHWGEVMMEVKVIGVCGSDIHVWHGKHPFTSYPVVQGHEFSGKVVKVGDGAKDRIKKGMKVTALPQVVCGNCGPCRSGLFNVCEHLAVRGFQATGCGNKAGGRLKQGIDDLQVVLGQGAPGLGVLYEQVRVLRQESLAGPPGGDHLIWAEMVIAGIFIGDIHILRGHPEAATGPHQLP